MKKILLLTLLAACTHSVMAQKKPASPADSIVNSKFNFKADTGLFSNKALTSKLFKGNALTFALPNKLSDYPSMVASTPERITYSKVDHMPILNTSGNSKMPLAKPQGNSKMPVVGKSDEKNEKVIIDSKP
ncbi:hypothetical protein [Mucilaginibacter glaciei]|uniref:Uncharacterized protein n=1 Tax=Mucilaginibacter glaciei TaxID=2772109 RepID=A0A926NLD6_9SPHI|nr:hypothetical protein [Mucilaginibacter glaciei]MBD1394229.1 hypothetical protein [Mucilaginibacter glaciei]